MFEKLEIRKAIYHELGCDTDDFLERAKRTAFGLDGAKGALLKASKDIQGLVEFVQRDLKDDKLVGLEPSEVADYAIKQIQRAVDALVNASRHYENRQISTQGEVVAYEMMVKHFKKLYDVHSDRLSTVQEQIQSGEIVVDDDGSVEHKGNGRSRVVGVRPSMSIAAQRKAEEEAAAAAAQEDPSEPTPTETVPEDAPVESAPEVPVVEASPEMTRASLKNSKRRKRRAGNHM